MSLISAMIKTYQANNLSEYKLKKIQYKRLKRIVNYAKNNSPYFNELYKDINNNFKLEEWELVPLFTNA